MAYVFRQNRDDGEGGASGMGQPSMGAGGMAEKRVGVDDSGAGGPSNTAGMGGPAPAAPKAAADFTKTKNAGVGAILQRNQGLAQDSAVRRVAGDAMRNLAGNTADLKTRSTEYLAKGRQGIADASQGLSDSQVRAGLAPGQTTELRSRLSAKPVQVKDFDPGSFRPIEAMDYLRSGDVSGLLGRESSANYSSGMGALDGLAFNRSGAGQQVKSQVGGLQSQFSGDLEKALGKEGAAAFLKKEAQAANDAQVAGLRGQIERVAQGITGGLAGRREAASGANLTALAAQKGARESEIRKILKEYQEKLAGLRKGPYTDATALGSAEDALAGFSKGNLDRYIKTSNPNLTDNMFLSDDEVAALNNASGLLGKKDVYQKGSAGAVSAGFDPASFRRELDALLNPGIAKNAAFVGEQERLARAKELRESVTSGQGIPGNEGIAGPTATGKKPTPIAAPKPKEVAKSAVDKVVQEAKKKIPVVVDPRKQAAEVKKLKDKALADAKRKLEKEKEKAKKDPIKTIVSVLSGGIL